MSPAPRHTEELAVEALYGTGENDPGLLNRLLTLTSGEPTTAELEEALEMIESPRSELRMVLRSWISSRRIINARQVMTGPKAEEIARALNAPPCCQVLDPETEAEFDKIEAEAIEQSHPAVLHPVFQGLTAPFRKPA